VSTAKTEAIRSNGSSNGGLFASEHLRGGGGHLWTLRLDRSILLSFGIKGLHFALDW
jgi:hypothetical protein